MRIGGICAVVATASIAFFCLFAGLHCMMQVSTSYQSMLSQPISRDNCSKKILGAGEQQEDMHQLQEEHPLCPYHRHYSW